jgi:hypothetical protein
MDSQGKILCRSRAVGSITIGTMTNMGTANLIELYGKNGSCVAIITWFDIDPRNKSDDNLTGCETNMAIEKISGTPLLVKFCRVAGKVADIQISRLRLAC